MNVTSWDIYWVTRFDSIKGTMIGVIVLLSIILIIFFLSSFCECARQDTEEEAAPYVKLMKLCGYLFFIPLFLTIIYPFIPTTKDACMMYAVPKLADSECVKQLQGDAKELYTLGIERLREELSIKNTKNGDKK